MSTVLPDIVNIVDKMTLKLNVHFPSIRYLVKSLHTGGVLGRASILARWDEVGYGGAPDRYLLIILLVEMYDGVYNE